MVVVVVPIEFLVGSSVKLRRTIRAPYLLLAVEVLGTSRIHYSTAVLVVAWHWLWCPCLKRTMGLCRQLNHKDFHVRLSIICAQKRWQPLTRNLSKSAEPVNSHVSSKWLYSPEYRFLLFTFYIFVLQCSRAIADHLPYWRPTCRERSRIWT